jgi:2,3-dihydroxybiphenyl 1,2-dioxygenase
MQLGYLAFEVADGGAWDRFLGGVLGLEAAGGGAYRMDHHDARFFVSEGPTDDLCAVGLEVDDLDAAVARVREGGVVVTEADPAPRRVSRRFTFSDPSGVPLELVTGAARRATSPGGFVADELGLGHVVLAARDQAASQRFYEERLGFKLSDRVVAEIHGHHADLVFLHCNPRHHTVALGGALDKRLHHLMVEAASVDAVGHALDRTLAAGLRVMHTLGRHPNDRMLSFYAMTPSGFQFEYGWGARVVDDATWQPVIHDRISEWGHTPPQFLRGKR